MQVLNSPSASGGPPGAPTRRAPGEGSPWTPYMHGNWCSLSLWLTLKLFFYEFRKWII